MDDMDSSPGNAQTASDIALGCAAATPQACPDWATLDRELRCPRCDYNLHMLTSPRCPECGLEFTWSALLSVPEYRQDCQIFEYRWRTRPVRSFAYTLWLVLRPWSCWRTIRVEFEPRLWPIVAQVILLLTTQSLVLMAAFLLWIYSIGLTRGSGYSLVEEARRYLFSFTSLAAYAPMLLRLAAPLPLILASLFVYPITYSHWRIRWQHVVRVGVYAWMTWLVAGATIHLVRGLYEHLPLHVRIFPRFDPPAVVETMIESIPISLFLLALALGFTRYLKLRGAWLAATASLLITTTAFATFSVAYVTYGRQRTFGSSLVHLDNWIPGLQWFCLRVLSAQ